MIKPKSDVETWNYILLRISYGCLSINYSKFFKPLSIRLVRGWLDEQQPPSTFCDCILGRESFLCMASYIMSEDIGLHL